MPKYQDWPDSPSNLDPYYYPPNRRNKGRKTHKEDASMLKTGLIGGAAFVGCVAATAYSLHKWWPKGYVYGKKEEREQHMHKPIAHFKRAMCDKAGRGEDLSQLKAADGPGRKKSSKAQDPWCQNGDGFDVRQARVWRERRGSQNLIVQEVFVRVRNSDVGAAEQRGRYRELDSYICAESIRTDGRERSEVSYSVAAHRKHLPALRRPDDNTCRLLCVQVPHGDPVRIVPAVD